MYILIQLIYKVTFSGFPTQQPDEKDQTWPNVASHDTNIFDMSSSNLTYYEEKRTLHTADVTSFPCGGSAVRLARLLEWSCLYFLSVRGPSGAPLLPSCTHTYSDLP